MRRKMDPRVRPAGDGQGMDQHRRTAFAMEIKEFLLPADTLIKAHGTDKTRLLQELAARAAAALNLDAKLISGGLLKRENLGSTGTGGGVAIPHARLADLKRPFGTFVRLNPAINFD